MSLPKAIATVVEESHDIVSVYDNGEGWTGKLYVLNPITLERTGEVWEYVNGKRVEQS